MSSNDSGTEPRHCMHPCMRTIFKKRVQCKFLSSSTLVDLTGENWQLTLLDILQVCFVSVFVFVCVFFWYSAVHFAPGMFQQPEHRTGKLFVCGFKQIHTWQEHQSVMVAAGGSSVYPCNTATTERPNPPPDPQASSRMPQGRTCWGDGFLWGSHAFRPVPCAKHFQWPILTNPKNSHQQH